MQKRLSILAIGSEILDGRVLDTNSNFVAQHLAEHGIRPGQFLVCDDVIDEIVSALEYLRRESDFIIVSGGLGPTTDDITREAVAQYCRVPLEFSSEEFEWLKAFFAKRGRPLTSGHDRQAMLPQGAQRFPNPVGTASAFLVRTADGDTIVCMPGPPKEFHAVFRESIERCILDHFGTRELHSHMFRVFGLPEAAVGDRIEALALSADIFVSYRAAFPEVQVKLKSTQPELLSAACLERVREALGAAHIFSEDAAAGMPEMLQRLFIEKGLSLCVAESCTGGMLGELLTAVPGSSAYFKGGVLSYSNAIKEALLDVPAATLEAFGAVSEETAVAMARGARARCGADFAASITGVAGPEGGSAEKPVGTFFVGIAGPSGAHATKYFMPFDRERVRRYACFRAMLDVREAASS